MSEQILAVYENGVFRPVAPVNFDDGDRVWLTVDARAAQSDDLDDLLDHEYIEECRQKVGSAPSIEEVQKILSGYPGAISDLICQERDER